MRTHLHILSALGAGGLFGIGLAMSGMTDANRVLGFLDVFGAFNPSLLYVLGGAVGTTLLLFRFVLRRAQPLLDIRFHVPGLTRPDRELVLGATLFGIGWGIAGYCPGPALAGLGVGSTEALWFVPAMMVGIYLRRAQRSLQQKGQSRDSDPRL